MIALGFLSPTLLWLAPLVGVPVLIYLWNRQRYRPMPWAAMAFIQRAMQRNRRRLKLENILLLLLRVLIVLLLVLAFARPVLERPPLLGDLGEERRNVLLVLDRTLSMGLRQGGEEAFERARGATERLARAALRDGDRFDVLLLGEEPSRARAGAAGTSAALYGAPVLVDEARLRRLGQDLAELRTLPVHDTALRGLRAVADYLPRFDDPTGAGAGVGPATAAARLGGPKQVFILSDMQRAMLAGSSGAQDAALGAALRDVIERGGEVTWIDCGLDDPANVAVISLRAEAEVVAVGQPVLLSASVQSFASRPLDLELVLSIDGQPVRTLPLRLEPGAIEDTELYATLDRPGAVVVTVEVRTDGLAADNARHLALEVREGLACVLVDGERQPDFGDSETDFLAIALAPGGDRLGPQLLRPRVIEPAELEQLDHEATHVIVAANVLAPPSAESVDRLEAFVRRGGGVLLFLGRQVDAGVWNDMAFSDGARLLPGRLGGVVERPDAAEAPFFRLRVAEPAHPVLSPFSDRETREELLVPRFWGFAELEVDRADPDVTVIATFEERTRLPDGREVALGEADRAWPALVERRLGRGRVLCFTSSADGAWNNFFAQYGYLMLWQRAVTYLADGGRGAKNLLVGETFEAVLPSSEFVPEVQLTAPDGRIVSLRAEVLPEEKDRIRVTFDDTRDPGVYALAFVRQGEGGVGERVRNDAFAVNVDTRESDLRRVTPDELQELFRGLAFKHRGVDEIERLALGPEGAAEGVEVWRALLYWALGLLLLESVLACYFGRRAQ